MKRLAFLRLNATETTWSVCPVRRSGSALMGAPWPTPPHPTSSSTDHGCPDQRASSSGRGLTAVRVTSRVTWRSTGQHGCSRSAVRFRMRGRDHGQPAGRAAVPGPVGRCAYREAAHGYGDVLERPTVTTRVIHAEKSGIFPACWPCSAASR